MLKLHLTVVIWGFTAILGVLITRSALILVWYRMGIAAIAILAYMLATRKRLHVTRKDLLGLLGIGVLVALHWFLFYYSIKIANASVALICLSSVTLFTSVLEPLVMRRKFYLLDIVTGLVIISGILVIFKFESRYLTGTLVGLGAALGASLFTIFNASYARRSSPLTISLVEMVGGFLALTAYLSITQGFSLKALYLSWSDLSYLLLLSTICTAMAYVMGVAVMKTLSPITVVLTTSLEPVYGIVLAYLIFGNKERMSTGFYVGGVVILLAVLVYPILKRKAMGSSLTDLELTAEKDVIMNKQST